MRKWFAIARHKLLLFFISGLLIAGLVNACTNSSTPVTTASTTASSGAPSVSSKAVPNVVRLDYAYYNPVSLVLKEKGWLEEDLAKSNIKVEWVLSQGSNKALEFLNGSSIDFGSTSGASALIAKANGNPIKSIYVYSKPEWTALVTGANSSIQQVADLKGKKVAATRGTDPFIFLLRALDQVGLTAKDVEIVPLPHADGKAALEKGDVDAWAGLDPFMAQTEVEKGSKLFYRNTKLISQGFLNVREAFAQQYPDQVGQVLTAYEKARKWAIANPKELKQALIKAAKLSEPVATKQLEERTDLSNSAIGDEQKTVISAAGEVLKKSGVIKDSTDVSKVVNELIDPQYVAKLAKS
ncbi:aliphatic sulfonate ABC transporter substrate-binding protein [Tumidithrix elongata RA019]|uniref:Putative aliphatic sulfonates-binding protein n=1 Tax=Tumidithrix elongata BACA0141 TaxID=2716417 RepID=A0AAW9PZ83_9CYAN|nr:aliphatic sulfonate ABC transporter substrate-binding protein [Tumidithrix elongata RA019]